MTAIIDVEFISVIEDLDVGMALWEVEAMMEDGDRVHGKIIGDGVSSWDAESFEPDED